MRRRIIKISALIIIIITVTAFAGVHLHRQNQEIKRLQQIKSQREADLKKTESQLNDVNTQKQQLDEHNKQLQQKATEYEGQINDLNGQLQAKRARQNVLAAALTQSASIAPQAAPAPSAVVNGCGDNQYANYIYMHESGCNTAARNAGGCRGIGQACPGSKLPCGDYDYACQNAWFTNYAMRAYGSWAAAYQFWINNHWW